jgi:hypothetical protein
MGNNNNHFRNQSQLYNGGGLYVLDGSNYNNPTTNKPSKKRMELKLLTWFFNAGYGLTILLNIDNAKGIILFIIAVLYGIARLIFYVIKQNQERRMRELDILEKKKQLQ